MQKNLAFFGPFNGCRSRMLFLIQSCARKSTNIPTISFAAERLAIKDNLCIHMFPYNKPIFMDYFHGKESTINHDVHNKEYNFPPYFDVNSDLIAVANDDLSTHTGCSANTNFQSDHYKGSNPNSSIMCALSVQNILKY